MFLNSFMTKIREKTREKIIRLIKENPSITFSELAKDIGVTIKNIEWNMEKLKRENVLRRI